MNHVRIAAAAAACAMLLAACSFQNKYEREADKLTKAVIANDLRPVQDDIAPGTAITRLDVARWSDELNDQGKLISLKETTTGCKPGWHCFNVKFQKHDYVEYLQMDDRDKVTSWKFHMAGAQAPS